MKRIYLFISIFFIYFNGYAQCDITLTFDINKIDSEGNESEYSGVLCNNEKIKLINNSVYQTTCPSCFSWFLPGVPVDSLVIDPILGTAEFSYSEDALNESFTLSYTDPNNGLCNDSKDTLIDVNVDFINPILSDDLIKLSCSFDTIIELDHETLLDSDIADYTFSWTVLYDASIASVIPPSPSNIEAPQFTVNSTESQFYGIQLEISNQSTACSNILTDPEFFKISAFDNTIQSNSTITCRPNMIDISTQNDIIIDSYEWNIYSNGSLVSNNNSSSISINLDPGTYDVELITATIDGCINQIDSSDFIQVNNYTAEIAAAPDSICFQGAATTSQDFSATITPDSLGIEYEVISYDWSIISSNSASAVQTPIDSLNVSYTFSEPGVYSLMYSATIDGSNTDCAYTDTIEFNVGINASFVYDDIICLGGNTFSASLSSVDSWSTGLLYEWTTTSDLVIASPSDSITSISSVTSVLPDSTLVYDLNFKVTNDVGCWEEDSVDIDVYEVHADFTVSDSVLHCLSQENTLVSFHNDHINTWNWAVLEGDGNYHTNPNPLSASTYIHLFESYGNSDVTLTLTSDHGCSDDTTYTDVIYVNNYTAEIATAPDNICFQGAATTSQDFSATITPDSLGIEYEVISYDWSIISSNSASAVQTPIDSLNVSYTFSEPGVYSLMYSATIDGSNPDCVYTDTLEFNVGINTSILSDEIICVGGNTFYASFGDADTWSTGLLYEWTTTSDLVIASPFDSITSISSVTSVLPDSTLVYDLNLKVTNDVGCWEEDSVDIDVYEVHADFIVPDSVLHCLAQDSTLISLHNDHINTWNWIVVEGDGNYYTNPNPLSASTYIHLFESYGNSDVTLTLTSDHGCSDDTTYTDVIYVNNYTAEIATAPDNICFQGAATTSQDFSATITPDSLGIEYEVISYDWSIISSNSASAVQTPIDSLNVSYTFSEPGVYSLMYSATIDGSNPDCVYTDTLEFNVGINTSILSDEIICVGGNTFNASFGDADTWSTGLLYEWTTTSDLVIASPFDSITSISSVTSVLPDSTLVYDLNLKVTNDVGCWEEDSVDIDVYEVHADFSTSHEGELCFSQIINFHSLHNDFISSYEWSYLGIKYDGNILDSIYTDDNDSIQFDEMGIYSFSLSLISEQGCVDTLTKDSIFDIKRPYPIWSLDQNNGCDEVSLSILDSSVQVTEVFYYSEYYAPELDSIYTLTSYDSISPYLQIFDTIAVLLDTSYLDSTYLSLNETVFNSFDVSSIFSDSILVLDTFYVDTTYTVIYDTLPNILQSVPIQQYLLNDVNNFDYLFPYNEMGEDTVEYVYPIKLKTSHEGCFDYLYDTITVFATPIIETSFSADTGCFPYHTVDFFDHSTYVDSDSAVYLWDFGDGTFSDEHNPSHSFAGSPSDTMVYDVSLTITSNRGCSVTKEITTVKVYANPVANFDYTSGPLCYGLADVYFSDSTSILTTSDPLDSVIWTYNGVDTLEEMNQDYMIHFDATGSYEVSLEIVDIHGCRGSYTDSDVDIVELDTTVALPILNYVSWTDSGMIVNFAENQDDNFSHIEVWQQPEDGLSYWLAADLNIDSLSPNYYVHEYGSPGLSASTFINNYYIQQTDSCGYESDTSINHSSILLSAISENYQDIEISWTRYKGWHHIIEDQIIVLDTTVNIKYEVYRSENNLDFERILTVIDTLPYLPFMDLSFTYIDKDLCNLNYTYYVLAKHPFIDEFQSRSNKVNLEPMFVDFTQSPTLSYSTVNLFDLFTVNGQVIEDYIVTEWEEWDESDMNYYKIDRYDAYYGWQEEVGIMDDSLFVDYDVDLYNDEYLYRVSYHDECGNSSPESNFGSNILLKGTQHKSHYDLNWNAYKNWEGGVRNYIIEYYQHQDNAWIDLETLSGTTLDYIDNDLQKDSLSIAYDFIHGVDTSYCYRVKAISYSDIMSYSNEYCFIAEPTNYFPNAFSPNNDGINDTFEYRFNSYQNPNNPIIRTSSFVKSINLQIFNKWGNLVFETNDLDFQWDGTYQNNGEVCPQGAYVISYEMIGFNESVISDKGIIYLLR